jgi:hypothetical protein
LEGGQFGDKGGKEVRGGGAGDGELFNFSRAILEWRRANQNVIGDAIRRYVLPLTAT